MRAGLGLVGKVPLRPGVVAFETAGSSINGGWRWEVLVQGHAEVMDEARIGKVPPQLPLVRPSLTTVLRISMELLTGWQYGTAHPSYGHRTAKEITDVR